MMSVCTFIHRINGLFIYWSLCPSFSLRWVSPFWGPAGDVFFATRLSSTYSTANIGGSREGWRPAEDEGISTCFGCVIFVG
jgi:hypothetical protein